MAIFLEQGPTDIRITRETAILTFGGGEALAIPLFEFRVLLCKAQRVIAKHDAAGEVIPFPKPTRKRRSRLSE